MDRRLQRTSMEGAVLLLKGVSECGTICRDPPRNFSHAALRPRLAEARARSDLCAGARTPSRRPASRAACDLSLTAWAMRSDACRGEVRA